MIGERRTVVRRRHGNGRPRQTGNAFFRLVACDLHPRRQQHAHVEATRRVADEVQLPGLESAAGKHLAPQRVGAPWDRGRRLGHAAHDAGLDAAPTERATERLLHVLEIAQRADGGEAEETRHQEHEWCRHRWIVPVDFRTCVPAHSGTERRRVAVEEVGNGRATVPRRAAGDRIRSSPPCSTRTTAPPASGDRAR